MESQDIWQQFTTLPPDSQALVADFIAFLKQRYHQPQSPVQQEQQNWRSDPNICLWQDREDLQDSVQRVRDSRDSEWRALRWRVRVLVDSDVLIDAKAVWKQLLFSLKRWPSTRHWQSVLLPKWS